MVHHRYLSTFWQRLLTLAVILILITGALPLPATPVLAATGTPIPLYPLDGETTTSQNYPPLGIPTVEWEKVDGATQYLVQFSSDPGFAVIDTYAVTTQTKYTPTSTNLTLFDDGVWYWHVRVEAPGTPGPFSVVSSFYKTWATSTNTPNLEYPGDGANIDFIEAPSFTWTRVIGASRYRIEFASSPDTFNSPLLSIETIYDSYQPLLLHALRGNGIYYWRVTPLDVGSHLGTASAIHSFNLAYGTSDFGEVPTPLEPTENAQPKFTPTFRWTAVKGAEKYQLEYMTDDGICEFDTGITVETRNTYYTPIVAFANDDYCWHVRAVNGRTGGDWSETLRFQKRWDIPPVLLTPYNTYKYGLYPIYNWMPVPGTYYYKIEIALNQDWYHPFDANNTGNPWYSPRNYYGTTEHPYSWRVTPYDFNNNAGQVSTVSSFQSFYTSTAPSLVYPFYYYIPNDSSIYEDVTLNPVTDLTAPYPVFVWQRVNNPWPLGGTDAPAYRIQVDTTPLFDSGNMWTVDTESTHAAPTVDNPFNPTVGQDYYWRVCPLTSLGGSCMVNADDGGKWWSQIWRARFDASKGVPPTSGLAPELLRPMYGDEWVEAVPLLEWKPFQDATSYQVEVTRDPNSFSDLDLQEEVPYPAYSSITSLAQRFLGRTDYGTFYWHVRAKVGGSWTAWSNTWRFQIASQSEWRANRSIMDLNNRLQIGSDPTDSTSDYELTTLYASNSQEDWYFGFNANMGATNMTYGLYLDLDHVDGSGAGSPPSDRSYTLTTLPAHQPEYAIFVDKVGGQVNAQNTWVYEWKGSDWDFPKRLDDIIDGEIQFTSGYIEIKIHESAINMASPDTGSLSLMLFSVNSSTNQIVDSVPSDPQAPGTGNLSRFTSVTEHMNLVYPFNTRGGDSTTFPSIGPFLWDFPTGGATSPDEPNPPSPFTGSHLQVCLDPACSTPKDEVWSASNSNYFASANQTVLDDVEGDSTYYWRVQPRYLQAGAYGAWNSGYSFERAGFAPTNLHTSVTFATPLFSWDLVDGAGAYDIMIATDPGFGSGTVVYNITTPNNSFIPWDTLANGTYYWKVRARKFDNIISDWSTTSSFVLELPAPTNLTLYPSEDPAHYMPTLCWDHMVAYDDQNIAVMAAWKYRVQVATDPGFSNNIETIDTEQRCWTTTISYPDGIYYWHVAMIDGSYHLSAYSAASSFTKQYPITNLLEPLPGEGVQTPTFKWSPVDGASYYKLEISKNPGFTPIYDGVLTVNTQYTPIFNYDKYYTYYWRVAIMDWGGRMGIFTGSTIVVVNFTSRLPIVSKHP